MVERLPLPAAVIVRLGRADVNRDRARRGVCSRGSVRYAAHGCHSPAISLGTPGRLLGGFSQRQARHTETQRHRLRFEPALSKESRIAACQRSPCIGWSQTWQQTVVGTSK